MSVINKGKVELVGYNKSGNTDILQYVVEHNNGSTSLEQKMHIEGVGCPIPVGARYTARIDLSDFPPQDTPEAAAYKMAEWLERLASAIRIGDYAGVPIAAFKDLD